MLAFFDLDCFLLARVEQNHQASSPRNHHSLRTHRAAMLQTEPKNGGVRDEQVALVYVSPQRADLGEQSFFVVGLVQQANQLAYL